MWSQTASATMTEFLSYHLSIDDIAMQYPNELLGPEIKMI
jgi:hypothetical protein